MGKRSATFTLNTSGSTPLQGRGLDHRETLKIPLDLPQVESHQILPLFDIRPMQQCRMIQISIRRYLDLANFKRGILINKLGQSPINTPGRKKQNEPNGEQNGERTRHPNLAISLQLISPQFDVQQV